MPIYMSYGDGRIAGDVTEESHENWIELTSLDWGLARPVTNPAGATAGRVLAAPRITDLTVTKIEDVATIGLLQESLAGEPAPVKIDFLRTDTGALTVYYTIALKNAVITAFAQSSTGERPTETITLNFTEIHLTGTQMDADGTAASPASYGWDVAANAPS